MEIRLTPAGHLRLEAAERLDEVLPKVSEATESESKAQADGVSPLASALREAFERDWREALFALAADRADVARFPTLRFWQGLAERLLTQLLHISEEVEFSASQALVAPGEADLASMTLTAPPMRGGEYLSPGVLLSIWRELESWVGAAVEAAGGLKPFLESRATKWHAVGRVCFHLAENKSDPERPFAFMATYTSGFGAGGRLRHVPLGRALEEYAGAKNRAALVKLLTPVQRATETCDWVGAMVASGEVYRPRAWGSDRAYRFLRDAPALEESGLSVRLPDWWRKRPRPRVSVTIGEATESRFGAGAMLDFDAQVALGDETLSDEELAALLSGGDGLVLFKGQWIEVDRERLGQALSHWRAIQARAENGEISFIEGMRLLAGAPADLKDDDETDDEAREWALVSAGAAMRETLAALRDPGRLSGASASAAPLDGRLKATLRPYQQDGVAWLNFLTRLGLGACLADDMGLGKTIQVLALLLWAKHGDGDTSQSTPAPSLLVIPASLLGNWRKEAERFAPSLRLVFLHPAECDRPTLDRISKYPDKHLAGADLVVTTYAMMTRQPWLAERQWRFVIADEAQAIKNPSTRQSKALKKVPAQARVALTGTPVENRLGDLWSLFDFLNPGLLGSGKVFQEFVKKMQERDGDRYAPLRRLVGPYILRRLKTDKSIIADLPEKTETRRYCHLTPEQVRLYEQVVATLEQSLETSDEMARRGLVLQTLTRLKQICNHPSQLLGDGVYDRAHSGKFAALSGICEELAERQEKALIFTQFKEIIDPLAALLEGVFGRPGLILHGSTSVKERKKLVERFQDEDGPPFFVLSLKAGGTGLNLTAASHVVHFDRWWNPAVENQATDRAFRIGQKRNVLVHKFVTRGAVEERIDEAIEEKRQMAEAVLSDDGEIKLTELPDDELLKLVRLDVNRAAL